MHQYETNVTTQLMILKSQKTQKGTLQLNTN
jgi:hypothetical protein